ncbi:hypothetical protein [Cellulomonas sp. KRMCY2]|uniref:hypothetical protein n=1 Tax=Cellulomonas sp. KRMCY2 TaxID=1304865 RepID=UPI00045E6440|nr:hypothetical protein [Cellulomonas sp. KRMCY2]
MTSTARPAWGINPEAPAYRLVVVALVASLFASAFALSASALVDVAGWANVHPGLEWLMAVTVDAGILIGTAMALHERQRGTVGRVRALWVAVASLTLISAVLNAAHALDGPAAGWQEIVGAAYAAIPPLLVWWATHLLAWVATSTPAEIAAQEAAHAAAVEAQHVEHAHRAKERRAADRSRAAQERQDVAAGQIDAARRAAQVAAEVARLEAETVAARGLARLEAEAKVAGRRTAAEAALREAGVAVDAPAQATTARPATPAAPVLPLVARTPVVAPVAVGASAEEAAVAELRAEGLSERAIAERLGLGKSRVHRILADRTATGEVAAA